MKYKIARVILTFIWLAIVINLLVPFPGDLAESLYRLGIILTVVHIIEFLALRGKCLADSKDSIVKQLLMTILYGIAYLKDQPSRAQ